jgi:hypothetical protein
VDSNQSILYGTVQFMAREIVRVLAEGDYIAHEEKHDIESFIWVLAYCIMRNILHRASKPHAPQSVKAQYDEFRKLFLESFGKTTCRSIFNVRHSNATTLEFPTFRIVDEIINNYMSEALITLFGDIQDLMQKASVRRQSTAFHLTHERLLEIVDKGIASLS